VIDQARSGALSERPLWALSGRLSGFPRMTAVENPRAEILDYIISASPRSSVSRRHGGRDAERKTARETENLGWYIKLEWWHRIPGFQNFGASGGIRISPPGIFFELRDPVFQELGFMNELIHFPLRRPLVPPILKIIR
jgi:hypothetical protein